LTIQIPGLKAVSSNSSPDSKFHFLAGDERGFLKEEVKTYRMAPMLPLSSTFIFSCLHGLN
jgi:hypothetical protein